MKRKLIIAPYADQRVLFNLYRSKDIFDDVKFITKEELIQNYYYSYTNETILSIIKEKQCDLEYATRLVKSLIYLDKRNDSYKELFDLRDRLIKENLLIKNDLFKYELENSEIFIHYYNEDKILDKILKGYDYKYIKEETHKVNDIVVFDNHDDQLFYVFNKIEGLLSDGVPANKIFIYGIKEDDEVIFDRLVKNYHLNVNNASKKTFIDIKEVRDFIFNYSGNHEAAVSFIPKDFPQYDDVISLINEFYVEGLPAKVQKAVYKQLFSITKVKTERFKEAISLINEPIINEDEYLFIVNYAQGIIPLTQKDDDVIDDIDKEVLGIPTSEEKNVSKTNYFINTLLAKGNIYFSFAKKNYSSKFMASPLKNQLHQQEVTPTFDKTFYSMDEARIQYANKLDLNRKYLHTDSIYEGFKKNKEINPIFYKKYDSQVSGIHRYNFARELELSYSSVKTFYECQYKYYLNKVAKVDELEDSFNMALGSMAHRIVELMDKDSTFDELYDIAFEEQKKVYEFTPRDLVLLRRIKEELRKTFDFLKAHEKQVVNGVFDREKSFKNVYLTNNIKLTGKVDKIIISGDDSQYVSIIDYKIGSESFNENKVQYGLSLQLPTYALYAKMSDELKDKQIIALAIQPLLSDQIDKVCLEDEDKYLSGLKMKGAFADDQDVLYTIDKNIRERSVYIGITITSKGAINASSKVFNQDWFTDTANLAKDLLVKAGEDILDNNFVINPKLSGGKIVSCQYCPFRDICYRDPSQVVILDNDEEAEGED